MLGQRFAHYEITAKLGQGGMGAVYRARDTKLDREVAIKVLPEAFAQDRERLARFEREARALAALSHPNIAGIHGLEEAGGRKALVLELVDGEDLSARLRNGPLPLEDALQFCRQIAAALETAHERRIVHRDLKPGNVKVTPDGKVKVLDFGLAKAGGGDSSSSRLSSGSMDDSPTLTAGNTRPGVVLGTAGYMSPEQARGRVVDHRSDIWSFGCVLFECLTGRRAFQGEDVSETFARIISGDAPWGSLPDETPAVLKHLLKRCLARDRNRRLQSIADARVELEDLLANPGLAEESLRPLPGPGRQPVRRGWLAVAALILAASGVCLGWLVKPAPSAPQPGVKAADLLLNSGYPLVGYPDMAAFALSRDGTFLVYNLLDGGGGLRLRNLRTGEDAPIPGARAIQEGHPFLAPDGSAVGFVADTRLVTVPISGGRAEPICDVLWNQFCGADWSQDGRIVYAVRGEPLRVVPDRGGEPKAVTALGGNEDHLFPQFLPGERQILFIVQKGDSFRAEVMDVRDGRRTPLALGEATYARYIPATGHLLFARAGDILAVRLDLATLQTLGKPMRVLSKIRHNARVPQLAVADDGTLVFWDGYSDPSKATLAWIQGDGTAEALTPRTGEWTNFDLSPDEQSVAIEQTGDIWILTRQAGGRETFRPLVEWEESDEYGPLWSPEGDYVYFSSVRSSAGERTGGIWRIKSDFAEEAEKIYEREQPTGDEGLSVNDFLSGKLLISQLSEGTDWDILLLDPSPARGQPELVYGKEYVEAWPVVSPSGRLLAYFANKPQTSIYVAPVEAPAASVLVAQSGYRPRWSADGTRLYYAWNGEVFASEIGDADGRIVVQPPTKAFPASVPFHMEHWDVSADGRRLLALVNADDLPAPQAGASAPESAPPVRQPRLKIVVNWFADLNRLAPADGP